MSRLVRVQQACSASLSMPPTAPPRHPLLTPSPSRARRTQDLASTLPLLLPRPSLPVHLSVAAAVSAPDSEGGTLPKARSSTHASALKSKKLAEMPTRPSQPSAPRTLTSNHFPNSCGGGLPNANALFSHAHPYGGGGGEGGGDSHYIPCRPSADCDRERPVLMDLDREREWGRECECERDKDRASQSLRDRKSVDWEQQYYRAPTMTVTCQVPNNLLRRPPSIT